jgi:hypothetical protein
LRFICCCLGQHEPRCHDPRFSFQHGHETNTPDLPGHAFHVRQLGSASLMLSASLSPLRTGSGHGVVGADACSPRAGCTHHHRDLGPWLNHCARTLPLHPLLPCFISYRFLARPLGLVLLTVCPRKDPMMYTTAATQWSGGVALYVCLGWIDASTWVSRGF